MTTAVRSCLLIAAAAALLVAAVVPAMAAPITLAHWEADNTPGTGGANSRAATLTADDVVASAFLRSSGESTINTQSDQLLTNSPSGSPVFRNTGWGHATPTVYYHFNLSSDAGLNLSEVRYYLAQASGNRSARFRLDVSTDNVTFTPGTEHYAPIATGVAPTWDEYTQAVSLAGVTDAYFRLYVWDTRPLVGGLDNGQTINVDDIRVLGEVVPEPSALGLAAVAGVLALRRRRAPA